MEGDLIFLQCSDVTVPFLWEESRLDFIQRRRAEISTHYNRVIGEYERELEKIHDELRRSPHCSNLLHTELIYPSGSRTSGPSSPLSRRSWMTRRPTTGSG